MRRNTTRQGQFRGQPRPTLLFTVQDVAELTGYSVRTIRRYIADGRLPIVRRRGDVFITPHGARIWLGHDLWWSDGWDKGHSSALWRAVPVRLYAALAGLTQRQVRHLIDKRALETVRLGGRVRVAEAEVNRLPPKNAGSRRSGKSGVLPANPTFRGTWSE